MRMSVRLNLPREVDSVPAVRRLLRAALSILRVDRQSGADLEIALTVHLEVDERRCAIDVVDDGAGFDAAGAGTENADTSTDRGRGLFLIRALAENVRMHSTARDGSLIHFEKSFA